MSDNRNPLALPLFQNQIRAVQFQTGRLVDFQKGIDGGHPDDRFEDVHLKYLLTNPTLRVHSE